MAVRIEVREFTITSGTGNIDFTGFSFQPKACLFILNATGTDNTDATDSHKMLGMCDGTRQWAIHSVAEDGVGTTDVGRRSTTTGCILHIDKAGSQAVVGKASFVSFLSDGVRVNRTTTFSDPTTPILRIIAFGGDDVSAYGDIFDPNNTQDATTSTTAVGFEPDVIITGMIGNHEDSDGATENDDDSFSIGWAVNPSRQASNNQYCIGIASVDASAQSESRHGIWNNRCSVSRQDDVTDTAIEITAFSSTGFTATTRDDVAGTNDRFFYLALKVGGANARIFSVNQDMPVATGSQSQTGAGFRPQFLLGLAIGDDRAFNTWGTEADSNNSSIGISMVDMARTYSATVWDEDEAGTSNTGARTRNTFSWSLNDQDGALVEDATFTSFDSSGWTQSFTQFGTLVRDTVYLAFGGLITTKTLTCDALLEDTFDKTFTIDARLSALKEFTCDALLEVTNTFNFTVDALLKTTESTIYLIDAFLKETFEETFTIDAILRGVSIPVDAILLQRFDEIFTVDSLLKKTQDKTFLVDALLENTFTETFTVDSRLRARIDETFTIDAYLRKTFTKTFTIDARLKVTQTKTFTADARLSQIKTFKIDGLVIKAIQFKVDAFPQATIDETFTVDSILIVFPSKVFSVDSILIVRNTEDFTLDARLRDVIDETFLVDALLEKALDKNFSVDALLETTNTETFTCDSILRAIFTETFTVDAFLKKTQDETFNIDAFLRDTFDKTFIVDGLIEDTFDETFSIDSILVNRFDETFTVDALLRATQNFNFTVDGIPFVVPSSLITIDAEIIISGIESFTIDARVELTSSLTFTCDSILKATFAETFSIDAITYLPIYETFSIDSLLEQVKTKTFTIDSRLEQANTKTFTLDSILTPTGATVKNFLIDARLKLTQTETFTIQTRLRFVIDKTYTVDAILKMTGDTLCSVLTPTFSDNFDSSTGWTTFGLITVDSLANPNVLRYNCVNSPNPGSQAIKTLPIPTGEEFRIEFTHNNIGGCTAFESYASFGLTDTTTRIGHVFAIVPKLEYRVNALDGPDGEGIRILYRSTISDPVLSTATAIPMNNNTTYYVRIDKNLASIITLSMFSDSARTIHVTGSPVQLDVSSQIKVPFLYVQASNVGPAGPGSARKYTGEIEDLVIYEDRCPNFLIDSFLQATLDKNFTIDAKLVYRLQATIDAFLKQRKTKTFTIDARLDASVLGTFTIDAVLVRLGQFTINAFIKALGDNRCPFENIFEEHFTTTSNWTVEINNTLVDGWGTQKIFIDGESLLSTNKAYVGMPPGGFSEFMFPILKSKYRRKKLDSEGGIGKVRGNNIRVDFELTYLGGSSGKFVVLNKSSLHPDNDPNTSSLHVNSAGVGIISATLDDGFVSATTPTINIGTGTKRYIVMESLGNTLTLNAYTDITHTTHLAGSPVNVNTSSVSKEQLDLSWLIIGANDKNASPADPDTVGEVDEIKIFSSPCPVAYVDAQLLQRFDSTFSIDAKLIGSRIFSVDAVLRGKIAFDIDANIVRIRSFDIDTILLSQPTKTFTVDPLLIGAVNKVFTVDGLPFVPPAVLFNADAIVNFQDINETFSIDSVLLDGVLFTFTIDALIVQFTIDKQFTVDSRIRRTDIQSFHIDAYVKMLGVNGVCNFQPDTNTIIDTGLEQYIGPITPQHEESVDILIGQEVVLNNQQVRSVTFLLRASGFPNEITETSLLAGKIWSNVVVGNLAGELVEATSENTINAQNTSGDLPASVWTQVTFTYNPLTTPFLTGNYVIGFQHFVGPNTNDPQGVGVAIPVISNSNVISGSAVMRREDNSVIDPLTWQYLTSISKDIVIIVDAVNGDDIVEGIGNRCPRIDAKLMSIFTETFIVDAITYLPIYETFTVDVEIVSVKTKTFIIDARLIGAVINPKLDAILVPSPVTFNLDSILIVVPSKVFNIDSILKGTISETFTVDTNLQTENLNKIFNCNALIAEIKTKTFTIDGRLKYLNFVAPFTIDAFVINEPSKFFFVDARVKDFNAVIEFRVDSYIEETSQYPLPIDAILLKIQDRPFAIDAILIVKDNEETFTIRASLAVTQPPVFFTIDALMIERNIRWRADGLLRLRKTKIFTIDALLATRVSLTNIVDAFVKELGVLQPITADALVKKETITTFIIDTFAEQANTKTFTVDARLIFPFKKPTVDARVVNRRIETFLVDSFIDPPFTVKPKVDALIKCLSCSGNIFCTNTFTIDARVGIGEVAFTIDAKLNKRKTFTIDAFTGELIDVGVEAESVINDGSMLGVESTFGIGGT